MKRPVQLFATLICVLVLSAGCNSPYRSDRGALVGGLLGAGTGAIIGDQLGNAGAGAAIGAGLGAVGGAVIGSEMDQIEAANRAAIARQVGYEVPASAVSVDAVISMTQAGVAQENIITHVRAHGVVRPLQPADLEHLTRQGVSPQVIKAMQEPPPRRAPQPPPVVVRETGPPPVVIREYHHDPTCYGPRPYQRRYYYRRHSRPGMSWGFSFQK